MKHRNPGILHSLSKMMEMHFIYAFFFEYRHEVFIKVGQSSTPYRRLGSVANGCPLNLSQAVFAQIGDIGKARSFELRMKHALGTRRTRGEWYCLPKSHGAEFNDAIKNVFAKVTGKRLVWTKIDLEEFFQEQSDSMRKWHCGESDRNQLTVT